MSNIDRLTVSRRLVSVMDRTVSRRKSPTGTPLREQSVLICPTCSRLLWPKTIVSILTRPARTVLGLLVRGVRGGGWKTVRELRSDEAFPLLSLWKARFIFAVQAWRNAGLLTDADFAFAAGPITRIERPENGTVAYRESKRWEPDQILNAFASVERPPQVATTTPQELHPGKRASFTRGRLPPL